MAKNATSMVKGETRNPHGRPKKGESLSGLMRDYLELTPQGATKSNKQLFVERVFDLAINQRDVGCMKLIMNYVDGMPQQHTRSDITVQIPIPILGNLTVYPNSEED